MHIIKGQSGIQFDSTAYFFDSNTITFDSNDVGTHFVFLPYKPFSGSTITVRLKDELTRQVTVLTGVEVEAGSKGTYRAYLNIQNLPLKSTYEMWLFSGSTEIYRGKLFIYLGETQNYSVVANEN